MSGWRSRVTRTPAYSTDHSGTASSRRTRYFPTLFVAIAAVMRGGVPPVAAAVTVSMLGLAAMVAAVFVLLKRLSVSSPLAMLGAALSAAPYFVHQTGFAVRCKPIAAAFAIAGLAVLTPIEKRPDSIRRELIAAALFSCAFITKMTCVYGPAAATLALLFAGRRWAAGRVAALTGLGIVLVGDCRPCQRRPRHRVVPRLRTGRLHPFHVAQCRRRLLAPCN